MTIYPEGGLKYIHVDRITIRENLMDRHPQHLPVITVQVGDNQTNFYEVQINGPCSLAYKPESPLPESKSHCYISTTAEVVGI